MNVQFLNIFHELQKSKYFFFENFNMRNKKIYKSFGQ